MTFTDDPIVDKDASIYSFFFLTSFQFNQEIPFSNVGSLSWAPKWVVQTRMDVDNKWKHWFVWFDKNLFCYSTHY